MMSIAAEVTVSNNTTLPGSAEARVIEEQQSAVEYAQDRSQWNDLIERKKRSLIAVRKAQEDLATVGAADVGSDKPSTP